MVFDRISFTKSAQETKNLGQELGHYLSQKYTVQSTQKRGEGSATAICLYGELGSGKTTFAQGFAKGLGIPTRLLSPTFIIVRRYKLPRLFGYLFHLDLYRVDVEDELKELGLNEMLADTNSIVVIEWAEKLESWLPEKRLDAKFSVLPDGRHKVSVT